MWGQLYSLIANQPIEIKEDLINQSQLQCCMQTDTAQPKDFNAVQCILMLCSVLRCQSCVSIRSAARLRRQPATQETTAMLFAYTNATLLLKWSKERSDVYICTPSNSGQASKIEVCLLFSILLLHHIYTVPGNNNLYIAIPE